MIDFFISDPHFGHKRIIELQGRPFDNLEQMTDAIVERCYEACVYWDGKLHQNVFTYCWVGDVFFGSVEVAKATLARIPGRHFLVLGNHDGSVSRNLKIGFEMVVPHLDINIAGRRVHVTHKPEDKVHMVPLIHGHTHSESATSGKESVHVGVDAHRYCPVHVSRIPHLMGWEPYQS